MILQNQMAEFQTSFIPKKPATEGKVEKIKEPVNPLRFLAALIFIVVFLLSGGLYLYKIFLTQNLITTATALKRSESNFDQGLINDIQFIKSD